MNECRPRFPEHIQCASVSFPIKKAKRMRRFQGGASEVLIDNDGQNESSCIVFDADCARYNSGASDLARTEVLIVGLDSIRKEGVVFISLKHDL